jgi:catechol 2,3-dioxygenase-like lactoylglutathione lyase family enzyme
VYKVIDGDHASLLGRVVSVVRGIRLAEQLAETEVAGIDYEHIDAERDRIRREYLRDERPSSSARGVHHVALLCSDVEATIRFYQGVLEFPLTEIFENRDYRGSNHFFFDIGNGNLLAFFDLPGLDLGAYAEVLGGLHHIAISVEPQRWRHLRQKLEAAGVKYQLESGVSMYFRDPDGARLELIADPLGEMYGVKIL